MKQAYLEQLKDRKIGILGLGVTGLACLKFLVKYQIEPSLFDVDASGAGAKAAIELLPNGEVYPLDQRIEQCDLLIVSPGIPLATACIVSAQQAGIEIIGDVELFARLTEQKVIGITGSNGKSTVTELVTQLLNDGGIGAASCGNIGVSVFDIVEQPETVAVLELSSYQLESTYSLDCVAATVLNVVEDHMDRYDSFEQYAQTKRSLYAQTRLAIVNQDDDESYVSSGIDVKQLTFGLNAEADFTVADAKLMRTNESICAVEQMSLNGQHDVVNALAAIALVSSFELKAGSIAATLAEFNGLPHRCQKVVGTGEDCGEVLWINDSKATNVGATVTAINSVKPQINGKLWLIAGGDSKAADFSPLKTVMANNVDALITLGQDAGLISAQYTGPVHAANSMKEAVKLAFDNTTLGDCVLLSPACASRPMFRNYIERGQCFINAATDMIAEQRREVGHG